MKKLIRGILFPLLLLATALTSTASLASPGRAVYVNGQVHRIWGSPLKHVAGQPRNAAANDWVFVRTSDVHTSSWCISHEYMGGSGLAIFGNKILYSYTSYSGCQGDAIYAYVATFDMATNAWTTLKRLGSVRTDLPSQGAGAGAAITVFDNKLYVFTDSGTYTSGDGVNWASYGSLLPGGTYQPLDAVTYYPPDAAPRILIVYGTPYPNHGNTYTKLSAATWNGQIGANSDFPATLAVPFNHWFYGNVSLQPGTLGALNGFVAGAKTAAVQLFVEGTASDGPSQIQHAEFTYSTASPKGSWRLDPHVYQDGDSSGDLWTYPWYTVACDATSSTTLAHQARQQTIVVHYHKDVDKAFAGVSDFMVPMNHEVTSKACGDWGGQNTDTGPAATDPDAATLRSYWSLYGVVLGSPPFAHNKVDNYEVAPLSNVDYGQSSGTKVQHTQEWENTTMFSAGLEVHAGLFHVLEVEDRADVGYKHAVESEEESSKTVTTGFGIKLGTEGQNANDLTNLGRIGWAIFGIPKVMVQDFLLYAYDYNKTSGAGTPLNQDVHVVEVSPSAVTVKPYQFDLEQPGGPSDDIPGLLSGIDPFPRSTDILGWYDQSWESSEMAWEVLFGDGTFNEPTINALTFTTGAPGGTTYVSQETEETTSTGETTKVEMSNQTTISGGTALKGFKVDLKVGYDSSYKTTVANTTSFGQEFKVGMSMKPCEVPGPDCVSRLTTQPYFLKAKDGTAPWVPTAYAGQTPWAIAWDVTDCKFTDGRECGTSAPPQFAEGLIVGGSGAAAGVTAVSEEPRLSHYTVTGAQLGWKDSRGKVRRLPINALKFDPSQGITIELNGHFWSSQGASGAWKRHGNVWTFKSSESVARDKVDVRLDFGKGTWDLSVSRVDFSGHLAAVMGDVQLVLVVNGLYSMSSDLRHHVVTEWSWSEQAENPRALALTSYQGRYDSVSREGRLALQGTLPEKFEAFGDMSFEVNGHSVDVPLLDLPDFQQALDGEGTLVFERDGLRLEVDFGKKTWAASVEHADFQRLLAPLRGNARIRALVGGVRWGSFEVPVTDFTTRLTLDN